MATRTPLRRNRIHAGLAATAAAGLFLTACGGVETSTGSGSRQGQLSIRHGGDACRRLSRRVQRPDQPCCLQGTQRQPRRIVPGDQPRGRQRRARGRRGGQGQAGRLDDRHPERVPVCHHPAGRQPGRGHQDRRLRNRAGRVPRRLRARHQPGQRLPHARGRQERPERPSATPPPASAPARSSPPRCCSRPAAWTPRRSRSTVARRP